ncbi:myricetin 7/4'-O-methyltransferase 2-like [Lycium barbarum]|uniref:myricetin 7/4'-O-methyltransferase 2-like n=1 Tax=Lycium barbarum TaxID=112863 RepID=UPI00293F58A1|nr:myricetin 7/4'-O-methyltransferase 2-like [Lycium barbarum]
MSTSESSTELLQAQAQIWNYIFSFISSSAVRCAVQLDIPDVLYKHGKPMHISDLSTELSKVNPSKVSFLPILMRFLVHFGFLNQQEDRYSLAPASRLLAKNHESFNLRSLLLVIHDPIIHKPWFELSNWFQNDLPTTFHTVYGKPMWELFLEEPRLCDTFSDAMANDSRLIANVLITECKHIFENLTSLVDVGGGIGTVLDLPHVIRDLKGSGNLEFVGGSMFEKIPNANAILLEWIMHDWSDEDCVKILKKCKESTPGRDKGGKLIIIDTVLESPKHDTELVRAQYNMDMMMLVCLAGKERTKKEWGKLFNEAGFNECRITSILGSRCLIEVYP